MGWAIELETKREVLPRFLRQFTVCALVSAAVLAFGGTEPWRIAILASITLTVPVAAAAMDLHRLRKHQLGQTATWVAVLLAWALFMAQFVAFVCRSPKTKSFLLHPP